MIVIIGGGLAGLAAASRLQQAGADWLLLEANDQPGGRVATEVTPEGFHLDRGFQVLLDSYPTARELLDIDALRPRYFQSGALLATGGGIEKLLNPLRHPEGVIGTLASRAIPLRQKMNLAWCGLGAWLGVAPRRDDTALDDLMRHGLGGEALENFLRPFFAGVFLENDLTTEASVFRADLRNFALGRALLPAGGMGEIPRQLAYRLPSQRQRYGARVSSLEREAGAEGGLECNEGRRCTAVVLENGERLPCTSVILATEEPVTRALLGLEKGRGWKSVTTLCFTGTEPLYEGELLVLPAGKDRLVRHFCDLTNVAPEYAPPGRRLLTATLLNPSSDPIHDAKEEIASIFPDFCRWEFLSRVDLPEALPEQGSGFKNRQLPQRQGANLWLAGDQVARASIDSALASGLQAADELLSMY